MNIQFCDQKYRKTNDELREGLGLEKGIKLKVLSLSFFQTKSEKTNIS